LWLGSVRSDDRRPAPGARPEQVIPLGTPAQYRFAL